MSLICLPNIPSRDKLESLKIEPEKLKYILTAEELASENWFLELELDSVESPAQEFEAIASIFTGSAFVFGTRDERYNRILERIGEPNKSFGPLSKLPKSGSLEMKDCKKKQLSDPMCIRYWNK